MSVTTFPAEKERAGKLAQKIAKAAKGRTGSLARFPVSRSPQNAPEPG
jgi:hypothetical protein